MTTVRALIEHLLKLEAEQGPETPVVLDVREDDNIDVDLNGVYEFNGQIVIVG